jgi:hypothetical protein
MTQSTSIILHAITMSIVRGCISVPQYLFRISMHSRRCLYNLGTIMIKDNKFVHAQITAVLQPPKWDEGPSKCKQKSKQVILPLSLLINIACMNSASSQTMKSRPGPEDRIMASLPTGTNCLVTNSDHETFFVYCKAVTRATNSQVHAHTLSLWVSSLMHLYLR